MASSRNLVAVAVLIASVLILQGGSASADDGARGAALFKTCAACHGEDAGGNQQLAAPAIAGLDQWYVEAQLVKFRSGARGAHPDDQEGMRMRPMARVLEKDSDVTAVAAHVAGMPAVKSLPTIAGGDSKRGAVLFTPCGACHNADGSGNPQLNGPSLLNASDWYLLKQLEKFKSGVRGANPEDPTGALMRPMAITLPDDQAMRDVVAYIMTLPN